MAALRLFLWTAHLNNGGAVHRQFSVDPNNSHKLEDIFRSAQNDFDEMGCQEALRPPTFWEWVRALSQSDTPQIGLKKERRASCQKLLTTLRDLRKLATDSGSIPSRVARAEAVALAQEIGGRTTVTERDPISLGGSGLVDPVMEGLSILVGMGLPIGAVARCAQAAATAARVAISRAFAIGGRLAASGL